MENDDSNQWVRMERIWVPLGAAIFFTVFGLIVGLLILREPSLWLLLFAFVGAALGLATAYSFPKAIKNVIDFIMTL